MDVKGGRGNVRGRGGHVQCNLLQVESALTQRHRPAWISGPCLAQLTWIAADGWLSEAAL